MARTKKEEAERAAKYRREHRDAYLKNKRVRYYANREKILAQKKEYAARHPEKIRERSKSYYASHGSEPSKRWYQRNKNRDDFKAKNRARAAAYHHANRDEVIAKNRARYAAKRPNYKPQQAKLSDEELHKRRLDLTHSYRERHRQELNEKTKAKRRSIGIGPPKRTEPIESILASGLKACTRCKERKGVSNFCKDRYAKNGLSGWCKQCVKVWNAENKAYYAARHIANKSEHNKRSRENYQNNRENMLEYNRRRYREHPEQYNEATRKRRLRESGVPGFHTKAEWLALCESFGNRCVCCGRHSSEAKLTRDHIVPIINPLATDGIDNIQPLCSTCNCSKNRFHSTDYRKTPFTRTGQSKLFG